MRPSLYMRFSAGVCGLLAVLGAVLTVLALGLVFIPQDAGAPATGEWAYALVPGIPTAAFAWLAVTLWRNSD